MFCKLGPGAHLTQRVMETVISTVIQQQQALVYITADIIGYRMIRSVSNGNRTCTRKNNDLIINVEQDTICNTDE